MAQLSALHLSVRTARLLDLWAGPLALEAPVLVAANVKGWFVATRQTTVASSQVLPEDLCSALRLGRMRGFDYLFFHSDAVAIPELGLHMW